MRILGESIALEKDASVDIYKLKFLKDNPRVYACTHGYPDFDNLMDTQQQEVIFAKLCEESSVINLIPDVERHGGLMEPILIRYDTQEVIEGNSRLAVYRLLYGKYGEDNWKHIPCHIVSTLTDEQQAAFLQQIHVKGKARWSAYEKANFAYVRRERGWSFDKISKLFGESEMTLRTRVKVIDMMKRNDDREQTHFSYYDVLVRKAAIARGMKEWEGLRNNLLKKIKNLGRDEEENRFTAQELRKKLPVILNKPKIVRKYVKGTIDLDEGYQLARISRLEERMKQAKGLLDDVSFEEIKRLERNQFNAFKQSFRKLSQQFSRIDGMINKASDAK